jgi:hypothetical protein
MRKYKELSTRNQAEVIATGISGHKVPDRYATGDDDDKFSRRGGLPIDGIDAYLQETPEDECM